ncbi:hypothetical protein BD779DRAFT_1750583 [Infundibulicybe gibba]|nr:hypothetical protein BD779DRAFT_1750583 [Infundibulicybe gibba]
MESTTKSLQLLLRIVADSICYRRANIWAAFGRRADAELRREGADILGKETQERTTRATHLLLAPNRFPDSQRRATPSRNNGVVLRMGFGVDTIYTYAVTLKCRIGVFFMVEASMMLEIEGTCHPEQARILKNANFRLESSRSLRFFSFNISTFQH